VGGNLSIKCVAESKNRAWKTAYKLSERGSGGRGWRPFTTGVRRERGGGGVPPTRTGRGGGGKYGEEKEQLWSKTDLAGEHRKNDVTRGSHKERGLLGNSWLVA